MAMTSKAGRACDGQHAQRVQVDLARLAHALQQARFLKVFIRKPMVPRFMP